jgi:hypothetical protein
MSSPPETQQLAEGQPGAGQKVEVEAKGTGGRKITGPSAAQIRAEQAKADKQIALIKVIGINVGANIIALGIVIALVGVALKDGKEAAYAPLCTLLGTLMGFWFGKVRSGESAADTR